MEMCENCDIAPNCNGCKQVVHIRGQEITVNGVTKEIIKVRDIEKEEEHA